MKILWQINKRDIQAVQAFYSIHKNSAFVKNRINRNVKKNISSYSNETFWEAMISCLITTQQRSGPSSPVTKFICNNPFPLRYSQCKSQRNLPRVVEKTLSKYGLRRGRTIGAEVQTNLSWLENGGWRIIKAAITDLMNQNNKEVERHSAELIIDNLKGFGPKQSRNLFQSLGLTKYEIPIDSRIIKWLNKFGFPLALSGGALADKHYFNFVLDGFQELCKASNIYPCVMDAAIFSSFDDAWLEDKLVW